MKKARFKIEENVSYRIFDKNGNLKKTFKLNIFGNFLLKIVRKLFANTKINFFNNLVANGIRIPIITGFWTTKLSITNGVTNAGKALIAGRINGSGSPAAATYIGVGVGTTAFAAGDTALGTEKQEDGTTATTHKAATVSLVTTDVSNDTAQLVALFEFTATLAITESGVFNASSDGTMLARQVFSAINVVSGDSIEVTWQLDVD